MTAPLPAPLRPRRRKQPASARRDRAASYLVYGVCIVVLLALVVGQGVWVGASIAEKRELSRTGITAPATIAKHHKTNASVFRRQSTYFLVEYTFTPQGGSEELSSGAELTPELWNAVDVGSEISVVYSPNNPADNQPALMLKRLVPLQRSIIGIYVGVIVTVIFGWSAISVFRVVKSRRRKPAAKNRWGQLSFVPLVLGPLAAFAACLGVLVVGIKVFGPFVADTIENTFL